MAGNDGAASLHAVATRVTLLDANGAPRTGVKGMYVTDNLVKLDFNPDVETGPEISDRNASGALAVVFKIADVVKRLTCTVDIIVPDPELETYLAGGSTLVSGSNVEGFQYPALMAESSPNGVSIEVWTRAVVAGRQPTDYPYWRWLFPLVKLRKSNRTIDINRMGNAFEGFMYENPNFGAAAPGTATGTAWTLDSSKVAQVARDSHYPAPELGGQIIA